MRRSRLIAFVLALVLCAIVVGVALASPGGHRPAKPHPAKAAALHKATAHHAATVHRTTAATASTAATDPDESASESDTVGDQAVDGVDAGGDHQCPPDCAPGETP